MGATAGQRSEANHEEMQTRERNHVNCQLAEVGVELARETEAGGDSRHDGRNQVVQVTVRGVGELEGTHADVIQSLYWLACKPDPQRPVLHSYLIINAEGLVGVLNQLVDGEGRVVRLDNGVGDLGGRDNGEGGHHAIGELLTDLGDQEGTHTGTGTTTKGMGDLEALEAVAGFGLAADDIDNLVNQFGTLGVVTLGPVVTSTRLAENKVVGTEELTKGTGTDGIHGTGLEVDQNGTGNILVSTGLSGG